MTTNSWPCATTGRRRARRHFERVLTQFDPQGSPVRECPCLPDSRTVIVDGFSPVRDALSPVVVNGGPWQRTLTPVQFGRLRAAHGLSDAELLRALRPEHLAPCYGFVQVDPYEDTPALPRVRYWRAAETGGWEFAARCGRQPAL